LLLGGNMHIVFVYGAYENIGIEYLSAMLKKRGHKVSLIYIPLIFRDALLNIDFLGRLFSHDDYYINELVGMEPDMVAFSCVTDWFQWNIKFAKKIKEKLTDIPIIFGGIHATSSPDFLLEYDEIDYVCIGEGEYAICDLADALEYRNDVSKISNICGKGFKNKPRPLINDLDALPFPDKALFYDKVPYFSSVYTIMASRGCPFSCSYCINNSLRKIYDGTDKYWRKRSIENIIKELKTALEKWDFKEVMIEDDIFMGDIERTEKFCRLYKKYINKPFVCVTHPKMVDEKELALLKDAGCIQIEIGIQTLNEKVRRESLNRYETNEEIINALKLLHRLKIPFNIDHIVGLPGDSFEYQLKALSLYNEVRPNRLLFFFITFYPDTEIAEMAEKEGILDDGLKTLINEGLSESDEQFGSIVDENTRKMMGQLRFLFGYLPLLPKRFIRCLLRPNIIRHLPNSIILCKMIPAIIATFFGKEPRGKMILKKYLYHILRMGF